ncbi:MAG: hypothetical protein HYY51_01510 [Candidatus Magasanikbacteria bacterium]|nr:hypothetical protein [Candidatus Magasanikbacteria bacterium]
MPKSVHHSNTLTGEVLHEWTILEYEQHKRNVLWYTCMLVIGLALVAYALFTGNFLFALIIVLFSIILFLQSQQDPPRLPFRITELGIVINSRFYSYSELENFYIIYNPPEIKTLFFEPRSSARPRIRVPLGDQDPSEIRFTLREFLPEDTEREEEPFSDMFARRWLMH